MHAGEGEGGGIGDLHAFSDKHPCDGIAAVALLIKGDSEGSEGYKGYSRAWLEGDVWVGGGIRGLCSRLGYL